MEHGKEKKEKREWDESGYSEKRTDLDTEIRAGEWQSLRRFRTYRQRSRQGKIIATYQAVSNRLNQLVGLYYKIVGNSPQQGEKMLEELRRLRLIQEILLECLVWSQAGREPEENHLRETLPPDVWDLIK